MTIETFTKEDFETFKKVVCEELILTHGNQLLTGAPFYPGGIPYTLFFQWGNLFGVAKSVVHPDEKAWLLYLLRLAFSLSQPYLQAPQQF